MIIFKACGKRENAETQTAGGAEIENGVKAIDLFTEKATVFPSKGEMRKLVQGGGVSLNKEKLSAPDQVITAADLLDGKYLLVQRGKKNYYLLIAK